MPMMMMGDSENRNDEDDKIDKNDKPVEGITPIMLSELFVKDKRRKLSRQLQPTVVGLLPYYNNAAQIISDFPVSRNNGSI